MRGKLALPLVLTSLTLARAQEPQGKIVFFREHHFYDTNANPPVFCDGILLGRIVGGTYLEVSAPVGAHQCVAESAQSQAAIVTVEDGGVVYFRVDIKGDIHRHAILETAPESEYLRLKSKLQPLSAVAQPGAASDKASSEPTQEGVSPDGVAQSDAVAERDKERLRAGEVTEPRCESCPSPGYTPAMRKAKLQGTVTLRVLIHADGHGTVIKVLTTSGYKDLDDSAAVAIRDWRFKPSQDKNGAAVDFMTVIEVVFRLLH